VNQRRRRATKELEGLITAVSSGSITVNNAQHRRAGNRNDHRKHRHSKRQYNLTWKDLKSATAFM